MTEPLAPRQPEDLISEFAAKRSAIVESESAKAPPDYLESIDGATVDYNLRSVALPLAQVDVLTFLESMAEGYGTTLSPVAPGELIRQLPADKLYQMSQADLLSLVFKRDSVKQVVFEGGRFPLKFDFVPIRSIAVNWNSIHVSVEGSTRIAENVAQEVLQLIWAAAGSRRGWDDLAVHQVAVGYGTQTRIRLPLEFNKLLGTELQSLIDDHLLANENFAASMRPLEKANSFSATRRVASVVSLSALSFRIDTMDLQNGVAHGGALSFHVPTRADVSSGTIAVSSALGFDDHMRLIRAFLDLLNHDGAKASRSRDRENGARA